MFVTNFSTTLETGIYINPLSIKAYSSKFCNLYETAVSTNVKRVCIEAEESVDFMEISQIKIKL